MTEAQKGIIRKLTSIIICLFAVLIGFGFYFQNLFAPINSYDEGIMLENSFNILKGLIPYRDFWTLYPPGYYYLFAGIFKIFGINDLVFRIADFLFRAVISLSIFALARHYFSKITSIVLSSVSFLWLVSIINIYINTPTLMLMYLALLTILKYFDQAHGKQIRYLIISGVLAGLTGFIRWDFGICAYISLLSVLVIDNLLRRSQTREKQHLVRDFSIFTGSVLIILVPLLGLVVYKPGLNNFIDQVFIAPLLINHQYRAIPQPSILDFNINPFQNMNWIRFYLPLLVVLLESGRLLVNFISTKEKVVDSKALGEIVLLVWSLFFLVYSTARYDISHILPALIVSLILLVVFLKNVVRKCSDKKLSRLIIVFVIGLFIASLIPAYILTPLDTYLVNKKYVTNNYSCFVTLRREGCSSVSLSTQKVISIIESKTKEDTPIFIGNFIHDKIFINDMSLYFLLGRPGINKYQELYPGVATTSKVQNEIVNSLIQKKVVYIILVNEEVSIESNLSSTSSGVFILDNYIQKNYQVIFQDGIYKVLKAIDQN
ncbi:MAG: glycosyltransferase family 39 protein [Anaerolineaceae bacterium]|nr:glycosyltransferase family 39 protein [Anaerolineaceae bacterium]